MAQENTNGHQRVTDLAAHFRGSRHWIDVIQMGVYQGAGEEPEPGREIRIRNDMITLGSMVVSIEDGRTVSEFFDGENGAQHPGAAFGFRTLRDLIAASQELGLEPIDVIESMPQEPIE